MVVSHPDLSEVSRVELIHVNSVVMQASSFTAASRVASVFAHTTMTTTNVTPSFSVLAQSRRLET